jgi:lipoprotein-releasing system ATP-binding protein
MNNSPDREGVVLEARQVQKIYTRAGIELPVLKGVDLKVRIGEMLAIVGPSGAGKSTLLHILGGLDRPTHGKVWFEGVDVYAGSDKKRARSRNLSVGFVFQFYHLLPEFNALENVILPAMIQANDSRPRRFQERGRFLLDQVGLTERLSHKPAELSGGEQQRVAIARALMNEPKIIFCDEPTGNLNSETGHEVIELIQGLNRKSHHTFVMVTHDPDIAAICGRIVSMRDGLLTIEEKKGT